MMKKRHSCWGAVKIGWMGLPGSSVVKNLLFYFRGTGSIPDQGTKILHALQFSKTNKKRQAETRVALRILWSSIFS